jgi:hypothetical protein
MGSAFSGNFSNWITLIIGVMAVLALYPQCAPINSPFSPDNIALTSLSVYAVTCTISPHSNIHMAIPIVLPLILFVNSSDWIKKVGLIWSILPAGLFLLSSLISMSLLHPLTSMSVLLCNIFIVYCVFRFSTNKFISKKMTI